MLLLLLFPCFVDPHPFLLFLKSLYLHCFVRQGPVEVDEIVSTTLLKEFNQEALCSENATEEERQLMSERLEQLFANGIPVSETKQNVV